MRKEIQIVQFVEAFGGGVYTYVKDLCNFLVLNESTSNIKIHLIYSPNRVEFDKEIFKKEIHPNVILHELKIDRKINLSKDINIIKQIRKLLKEIQPDILHLHSSKAGVIGRFASFRLVEKNKIFYSPHGYSFLQKNISNKMTFFYKFVEYATPFLFGGITIASGYTEYKISKKISKSLLIKNGVDFMLPEKLQNHQQNKQLTIGTIGRLTLQKNPKLFNTIAEKLPEVNFIWIGNGELENEITSKNIIVTGWVKTREELLKKLNEVDVYLQVSLWEGLPIALIEAMAMRKPLLVSNIVGNKDCVENGYNGFTFESVDEAVDKINFLKDSNHRKKMGDNSFNKGFNEYNKVKNFHELVEIYLSYDK